MKTNNLFCILGFHDYGPMTDIYYENLFYGLFKTKMGFRECRCCKKWTQFNYDELKCRWYNLDTRRMRSDISVFIFIVLFLTLIGLGLWKSIDILYYYFST